jgi:DNA-binding NarL/FixJ family response regulator
MRLLTPISMLIAQDLPSIRVLTANDRPFLRERIANVVAAEPGMRLVASAANGREEFVSCLAEHLGVALMDVRMLIRDAIKSLIAIRRQEIDAGLGDRAQLRLELFRGTDHPMCAMRTVPCTLKLRRPDGA